MKRDKRCINNIKSRNCPAFYKVSYLLKFMTGLSPLPREI